MAITDDQKIYLTGASSHNGAQTDPALSLGNYRASTPFVDDSQNNLFPPISSTYATPGDYWYLCLCAVNTNADTIYNTRIYQYADITATLDSGYADSGAISITIGDTSSWGDSGYAYNTGTGEWMFFSATSSASLSVPASNRGLRGSSAATGSAGETIALAPWTDLAIEVNSGAPTNGAAQTIADRYTAPTLGSTTNGSWITGVYTDDYNGYSGGIDIDIDGYGTDMEEDYQIFIWQRLVIPADAPRDASIDIFQFKIGFNY